MLSFVLTLALAKGPVAVLVTSRRAGAEAYSEKIAARVEATLEHEGVKNVIGAAAAEKLLKDAGYSDPRNCQGAATCISKLALIIGPSAVVVSVDVGKVVSTLAVHLEAVAGDKQVLASADFAPDAQRFVDDSLAPITVFARSLVLHLGDEDVKPTRPAPELQPAPEPLVLTAPPRAPPASSAPSSHGTAVLGMGAGVVVSAALCLVFGLAGLQAKHVYDGSLVMIDGMQWSVLPRSDLDTLAGATNLRFSLCLGAAVLTALFAAAAIALGVAP